MRLELNRFKGLWRQLSSLRCPQLMGQFWLVLKILNLTYFVKIIYSYLVSMVNKCDNWDCVRGFYFLHFALFSYFFSTVNMNYFCNNTLDKNRKTFLMIAPAYNNIKGNDKGAMTAHNLSIPRNHWMFSPCTNLGLDFCIKIRLA